MLYAVTYTRNGTTHTEKVSHAQANALAGYLASTFGIVPDVRRVA